MTLIQLTQAVCQMFPTESLYNKGTVRHFGSSVSSTQQFTEHNDPLEPQWRHPQSADAGNIHHK